MKLFNKYQFSIIFIFLAATGCDNESNWSDSSTYKDVELFQLMLAPKKHISKNIKINGYLKKQSSFDYSFVVYPQKEHYITEHLETAVFLTIPENIQISPECAGRYTTVLGKFSIDSFGLKVVQVKSINTFTRVQAIEDAMPLKNVELDPVFGGPLHPLYDCTHEKGA